MSPSESMSSESQLLRSSILLATVFAAAKQESVPQLTTHDVWQRMESSKSAKRTRTALTHWATTLTRGGTDDRLLAVVVGEFCAAGLDTLVVRSSPSSSQLDAREFGNSSEAVGSVHAHNPTEVDLSALESTLVSFLDKDHKFAKDIDRARTTSFNKYAGEVVAAIQIASRLRPAGPEIGHALQCYVVVHCLPKLTLRASSFARLFPDLYPKLANAWAPSPDEFSADVKITAPPDLLTAAFRSSDPAPLTAATAAAWWRLLCQVAHLLVRFVKGAATEPNIAEIVHACTLLQDLVRFAPSSLWASHSLDRLLIPKANEGSEARDKIEDEEMRDGNVTDAADTVLDARPHSRQFLRATESLCAWVTAPWHLVDLPIAKKGVPVKVHVVDLPRAPIASVTPDDLAARWAKVGRWSDEVAEDVHNTLTAQPELLDVTKGATHCEAALLASLARHAPQKTFASEKTTEPDGMSRKTTRTRPSGTPCERNPTTQEPLVLEALFEHLHLTSDTELPLPVGVAKKCCPACAILADIIPRDRGNLVLDLPGSHARWLAWAPPEWLPEHILRELEVKLVQALTGMLNQGRHSSPTSPDSPSTTTFLS